MIMLKTLKHAIVLSSLAVTCVRGINLNKSVVKSEGQQPQGSGEWSEIEGKLLVHAELKDSKNATTQTNVGKVGTDAKMPMQTTIKKPTEANTASKLFPVHMSFSIRKDSKGARIRTETLNDGGALFFVKQRIPTSKSIFTPDDISVAKPETTCKSELSLAETKESEGKDYDNKKCEKWVFVDKQSNQKIVVMLNLDTTNRWVVSSMDYMGNRTFLLEDFTSERAASN